MSKAVYADRKHRHFGLALEYYAHFTSPIRRYPDLQVHRIIKEKLHGTLTEGRIIHYQKILRGAREWHRGDGLSPSRTPIYHRSDGRCPLDRTRETDSTSG